ncbi:AbrB/MazE/SpoVT family DNA-binding domain-containing protein [Deinococcus sp. QL22]|uniref:AbrB/MazE/SpoVT family DNA-binding domain-containing protein n=1 Tax=Deinococcus sp. QL22 TaxID=2939437 RepID=UPI002016E6B4|nr:AbrB/MazE/SpoVT family DNA-binding domain-containing protein [Deinococcus sp. QL22]UQN10683.1 AbrB/MazE/SpoVT family DNA-binding domain-containing protein [Deinococcus sp. QL22]
MTAKEAFTLEVKENGRVFLPVAFRQSMGIHSGDRLIVRVAEKGKAELVTAGHAIASTRGMFAHLAMNGESLADELIEERRQEAAQE